MKILSKGMNASLRIRTAYAWHLDEVLTQFGHALYKGHPRVIQGSSLACNGLPCIGSIGLDWAIVAPA